MSHTQGKLRITEYDEIMTDSDVFSVRGVSLPMTVGPKMAEAKANAHRLVACWNACDGIQTRIIENIVDRGGIRLENFNAIEQERDELVSALRELHTHGFSANRMQCIDMLLSKYPEPQPTKEPK